MTARLTLYCNGPDCPATAELAPHADGGFDVPEAGWLHVHVDGPDGPLVADYCGWTCYAVDVNRHAMDGGVAHG